MSTTGAAIRDRITSVCCGDPFRFTQATSPFDFDGQPSGVIDAVCRVTTAPLGVRGGLNFTEERTDAISIWIARKHSNDPEAAYRLLVVDVASLRAAVTRDGLVTSGAYAVPDEGTAFEIAAEPGRLFAVGRVTIPVNYDATL